jgi:DNA-binding XRE family transcriptional regulator
MLSKKIKFNPVNELTELTVPPPKPAEEYFPEWLKKTTPFFTKKPEFDIETGQPNPTVKMCMPFADTFSFGYIQETWTDIWIDNKNPENPEFYFPSGPKIMTERPLYSSKMIPHSNEYYPQHYTWHPVWMPELPPGYSCIITHPLNRTELPFHTFTGIIESDTFITTVAGSNFPFMLKRNFSGMIKKGTPMYQIIPFKRDVWESSVNEYDERRQISITQKVRQFMWGGYKKLNWKKKVFK